MATRSSFHSHTRMHTKQTFLAPVSIPHSICTCLGLAFHGTDHERVILGVGDEGYDELCIRGIFPKTKECCGYKVLQIIPLDANPIYTTCIGSL